jgi:hypothetical protein
MSPDFDFVDKTFCWCVEQKRHRRKLFGTDKCCCTLHDVWHSHGLIENSGFHCFFAVAKRSTTKSVVKAYEEAGLPRCADIIRQAETLYLEAKRQLAKGGTPADADAVRRVIDGELTSLEHEFYAMSDLITLRLACFIREKSIEAAT